MHPARQKQITRRLFLGGAAFLAATRKVSAARPAVTLDDILLDPALPVLGNPRGDIHIAEFFDYLCPSCKALFPGLKQLVAEDGGIRLVMKDWPINGGNTDYAARMVLAAAPMGAYEQANRAVMTLDGPLTLRAVDDALRGAGIDVAKLRDTLDIHIASIDALLERNRQQADALQLQGTPGFIIGDQLYRQVLTVADIKTLVARHRQSRTR